jgi:hypothetical protein
MTTPNVPWPPVPVAHSAQTGALLESFLFSVFDLRCATRIVALGDLPRRHQTAVRSEPNQATEWTAWQTPQGTWLALGRVDHEQSSRIRAPVVWIEWVEPSGLRHHGWWHSYRPNEWIAGRGNP